MDLYRYLVKRVSKVLIRFSSPDENSSQSKPEEVTGWFILDSSSLDRIYKLDKAFRLDDTEIDSHFKLIR